MSYDSTGILIKRLSKYCVYYPLKGKDMIQRGFFFLYDERAVVNSNGLIGGDQTKHL
jgi:hypothetical protein